jgi:hypothetical protein
VNRRARARDARGIGHVELDDPDVALQRTRRGLAAPEVARAEQDHVAARGELAGDLEADPAGGARDEGDAHAVARAASWPQAASMSRPRVRRTVARRPCSSSTARKMAIASRLEPSKRPVGL